MAFLLQPFMLTLKNTIGDRRVNRCHSKTPLTLLSSPSPILVAGFGLEPSTAAATACSIDQQCIDIVKKRIACPTNTTTAKFHAECVFATIAMFRCASIPIIYLSMTPLATIAIEIEKAVAGGRLESGKAMRSLPRCKR
jgi:hypothetical protein